MSDIRSLTKFVEASRAEVKAPVLTLGKQIDALAAELTNELEAESVRLGKLLGAYQAEQRRAHEQRQREAWQQEQDILRAAQFEADKLRAAAPSPAVEVAVQAVEVETFQAVAVIRAAVAAAPVISGTSTRQVQCYEITDAAAVYATHPVMFTLTPNVAVIKGILKAQPNTVIIGLRSWTESVTNLSGRAMQ